jgi:hypothetical protein
MPVGVGVLSPVPVPPTVTVTPVFVPTPLVLDPEIETTVEEPNVICVAPAAIALN